MGVSSRYRVGGGVYVRLANVTSGAIDPASATFTVDVWRHA